MLVKLMHQYADGCMDGQMHVNPEHIATVCLCDDGQPYMRLTTQCYGWVEHRWVPDVYAIDRDSYDRIVAWMERQEVGA